MTAPAHAPRVLFIAGWGRSGSTLLDRLIGQHDGTASVGEMRDLWYRGIVEDRRCGCGQPFSQCPFWMEVGRIAFGGWDRLDVERVNALRNSVDRPWTLPLLLAPGAFPRSAQRALREYADLLRCVYEAIAVVSGDDVVVDSTKIATHALVLRHAGLDLRVVHLVRDARGVMHSWQKSVERPDATDGDADAMLRYSPTTGSLRYVVYNSYAHLLERIGLPYLLLRYEDLVRDPSGGLGAVLGHVDGELAPELAAQMAGGPLGLAATHTIDGNPMRFQTGPVRVRVDEAWRTAMPARSRRVVTALTAPLLRRYGYPLRGAPEGPDGTPAPTHVRSTL